MIWWFYQVWSGCGKLRQSWNGSSYWTVLNYIDYDMMGMSRQVGQIGSCQIILIMTWGISQVIQVKLDNVRSYWLWHNESTSSVGSSCIMSTHIDYDMMDQSGLSGQIESCQTISIKTWWISQDSQVKLDHINHINCDMMHQLGQLFQLRSCQIISIMTWCVSQVS